MELGKTVLRGILKSRREEAKGGQGNLYNERSHEPFSSAAIVFMCVLKSAIVDSYLCLKIKTKNNLVTCGLNYEKPLDFPDYKGN
jgi:hypothetical protein